MYTLPSVTINYVTYTAKRWGQFPTITYSIDNEDVTAGNEIVIVADDLSDITIEIEDGVSTNAQIKAAIEASDRTVQSLFARDLVLVDVESGKEAEVNTEQAASAMTGAVNVPPPIEPASPAIEILVVDPTNPTEGQFWYNLTDHVVKYFDGTTVQTVAVV